MYEVVSQMFWHPLFLLHGLNCSRNRFSSGLINRRCDEPLRCTCERVNRNLCLHYHLLERVSWSFAKKTFVKQSMMLGLKILSKKLCFDGKQTDGGGVKWNLFYTQNRIYFTPY